MFIQEGVKVREKGENSFHREREKNVLINL